MKVTLLSAVSLDGFIATLDGNSDWVKDDEVFDAEAKKSDCLIIGRKTYEQYEGEIYPVPGVTNIILTSNATDFTEDESDVLHFVGGSPEEVLNYAKNLGYTSALLAGGAETNSHFAEAGLIDEIIIDVHPVLLGSGKPLLGDFADGLELKDIRTIQQESFTQIIATVSKS